ncbi:hypothetical protein [Bosea minatitlanensis]|uniref:Uncharacterized protein n=1 Tax=Bosea minatitlanensis TaxID=128782 RepID=A0ABW0F8W6_9HYPH|nr:hypothetical protein [Bosea minatitlanensis]MCT4496141.1 hypothetical protein [Bosea minatitlanensis]
MAVNPPEQQLLIDRAFSAHILAVRADAFDNIVAERVSATGFAFLDTAPQTAARLGCENGLMVARLRRRLEKAPAALHVRVGEQL